MTSIQYVWHIRFVTLWEIMILLGRNVKIPHKRTHTHENPDSCGISLWSCSGSVPMRSVTDWSAAAVYSRRIAGPHLLIEPGGLNAEIGISVLVSLVLLRLVGHFQAQNYFLLFFFLFFLFNILLFRKCKWFPSWVQQVTALREQQLNTKGLCVSVRGTSPPSIFSSSSPTSRPQSLLTLTNSLPWFW